MLRVQFARIFRFCYAKLNFCTDSPNQRITFKKITSSTCIDLGHEHILDAKSCELAAAALGHPNLEVTPDGGTYDASSIPKGCHIISRSDRSAMQAQNLDPVIIDMLVYNPVLPQSVAKT